MVEQNIIPEWDKPIPTKCVVCGFMFGRLDRLSEFMMWCDQCFVETDPKLRFKKTTPEDIAEMKARQEKTRQSLRQRAIDKKNKRGLTTGRKPTETNAPADDVTDITAADMLIDLAGDDVSIFNEVIDD